MSTLATATFSNAVQAEAVVDALRQAGFSNQDVSVVVSDERVLPKPRITTQTKVMDGAVLGTVAGGAVGCLLIWTLGFSSFSFYPQHAALLLMASTVNLVVGGASGALAGRRFQKPEDLLEDSSLHLRQGECRIAVRVADARERTLVREIFDRSLARIHLQRFSATNAFGRIY